MATHLGTVVETVGECNVDDELFANADPLRQLEIDGPVDRLDRDHHWTRLAHSAVRIDRQECQLRIRSVGDDQIQFLTRRFTSQVDR